MTVFWRCCTLIKGLRGEDNSASELLMLLRVSRASIKIIYHIHDSSVSILSLKQSHRYSDRLCSVLVAHRPYSILYTYSPIANEEVRPGDSIPSRLTNPSNPSSCAI